MSPPLPSLLARLAEGDPSAKRACVDRYGALVWSLARRYAPPSEAEDAVQDIFVDLIRSASRFDPTQGTEAGFVAMIARRRLVDLARRRAARRAELPAEASADRGSEGSDPPGTAALPSLPPDVEQKLDASRAARALGRLAPDEREVLLLATVEGLSYAEIAARKGVPLGTVKTQARRGLLRVRELLADAPELEEVPS